MDRLYAAWVLLLTRGLRRGELAGLRWDRVDLDELRRLQITRSRVSVSGKVVERGKAKTSAGRRSIPLDAGLIDVLRAHRERQLFEQRAWGESWQDCGYVFVREDGSPYHPESISQRFDRLCSRAGVRRIRLHDLRHTAATLMLEDGTPVKVAAEMLGHANPAVTQATYQHVLPGMAEAAGERLSGRLLGGAS
jgi:integrase